MDVLAVVDRKDPEYFKAGKSRYWHLRFLETDYGNVSVMRSDIKKEVRKHTDFMLFTRNNQVFDRVPVGGLAREAGVGYSSVSALEETEWREETANCFRDFLWCSGRIDFSPKKRVEPKPNRKTFSLAFDIEQFGGLKFGLPGILRLLEKFDIPATFFITNIMAKAYKDLPGTLERAGHEIGIHGRFHEDLKKIKNQKVALKEMLKISKDVMGANLIDRMDSNTLDLLASIGIRYFVHPLKNTHAMFASRSDPLLVDSGSGYMWMVPIAVETYGKSWEQIKRQADITLKKGSEHITILLHPFADGKASRLDLLERLVNYLLEKGLNPARLCDIVNRLQIREPDMSMEMNLFPGFSGVFKGLGFVIYDMKRRSRLSEYHRLIKQGRTPVIKPR